MHLEDGGKLDEHIGKTFDAKYRIDKLIAKGGMGRVYRATQFPLERPVAIKILNREFQQSDPQFVKRFFLEASIAAQLSNPHTITVFDYGESKDGDLYIAMEYLRGRPLSHIIRMDGPFTAEDALHLSIQICRALRAAHEKGIIHRDLKPGNIFVLEEATEDGGGYIKVLDFGLVKLFTPENARDNASGPNPRANSEGELTRTGTLLGSPKYMSPEQIQGWPLDPRTDIYSFGIILYQMITGKAPFTGATGVDVIYKHVHVPVPAISELNPDADCPPELASIIHTCLKKRREDRFPSMDVVIERLKEAQKLISGESLSGSSAAPALREVAFREPMGDEPTPLGAVMPEPTGRVQPRRSAPAALPLLLAALGFMIALTTLVYVLKRREPIAPEPPGSAGVPMPPARRTPEPLKKAARHHRKRAGHRGRAGDRDLPPNYRENPY